jgi:hypothetical protein
MNGPTYRSLTAEQRAWLHDGRSGEMRDEWDSASSALAGVVSLLSPSYPRPMYFEGVEAEWAAAEESLACLRGTTMYEQVRANLDAARALWWMWEQAGHTDELHQLVDAYLDALTADSLAVRLYPATPAAHVASPPAEPRTRIAGAM